MSILPFMPAFDLASRTEEQRWLVKDLWTEQAVGIVGGEPKCCKSFLALDLAVSVAAGTACLRRFQVSGAGRVVLYAAEDPLDVVRRRLEGICTAAGHNLADLDLQVITAPTVRLDLDTDRRSLEETVAKLKPRLLVLDPFVRLHRIDENASGEVAPLLAFLRELQRRHAIAVLVVHHAKKGAGHIRAGQALRGSSEFHAWGDSNLYLRRNGDDLTLTVEHRAAPAMPAVTLELAQRANALALEVIDRRQPQTPPPSSVDERITTALADAVHPLAFADLREKCRVRTASLYERLAVLTTAGRIVKSNQGYRLTDRRTRPLHRQAAIANFRFPHALQHAGSGKSLTRTRPMSAPGTAPLQSILLFDRYHPSAPTCARLVPARAVAVKDGPSSGHRASGAQRP
jgi:hypothetical protein